MQNLAHRDESLIKELIKYTSEAILNLSNRTSLITVTRAELSSNRRKVFFYISVLPEEQEDQVLIFIERNADEIRDHLKKKVRVRALPFLRFQIDYGEKNRRLVTDILNEIDETDETL